MRTYARIMEETNRSSRHQSIKGQCLKKLVDWSFCYLDGKVLLKVLEFLTGKLDRDEEEDVGLLDVVIGNVPSVGTHFCLEPVHGDMSAST